MAFFKFAKATLVKPGITPNVWDGVRTASSAPSSLNGNLIHRAEDIFQKPFDPAQYLLSHATIVASVDVEEPPNVKLGSIRENGFKINRKYADYRVKTSCEKWLNNNDDGWERQTLLKSYPTFVGGQNFVEHVQVDELSKGRIIDAVARDIGDSVYIDILIATDKQHRDLIASIMDNRMSTLSMGCFLPGTMVTMADGSRLPIEEIAPGDLVITHTGAIQPVKNKQIKSWNGGVRRIRVVGVPTEIVATDNHPFVVYRPDESCACGCGEDVGVTEDRAKNLRRRFKRGHDKRIFNPNGTYSLQEARERKERIAEMQVLPSQRVRADELQVGDCLAFPRTMDTLKDLSGVTPGRARLLGYFLAEGSFLKRGGNVQEVQFNFSLQERDTYVQEVVDLLRSEFDLPNEPWVQDREDRNTSTVHVCGSELAEWFLQMGGEYSHKKKLHPTVLQWPTEMLLELYGAWINGDGTLHRQHGATVGTTCSFDLACQMQAIAAQCGMISRMVARLDGKSVQLCQAVNGGVVTRSEETGKLPVFDLWIGKIASAPLAACCDKVVATRSHTADSRIRGDVVLFPITSIESDHYKGWVHNMEVAGDHSYIVEGVATYNCTIDFSVCTKCGHVAADETEMCRHVRYEKGNSFFDDQGVQRRVAELCGHHSVDPTGGVQFIEASWVGTPAFTGAVLRNILEQDTVPAEIHRKAQEVLSKPPPEWTKGAMQKAAQFDMGDDDEGEEKEKKPEKPPLELMQDELEAYVLKQVEKRIKDKIREKDVAESLKPEESTAAPNNNIIKQALSNEGRRKKSAAYRAGIFTLVKTAGSDVELIDKIATFNRGLGIDIPVEVYRTIVRVGSVDRYRSLLAFYKQCRDVMERVPTLPELKTLIRLGKLLNMRHLINMRGEA